MAAAASPVTSRKSLILHEGPPRVWEGLEHFRWLGRKFPRTLNFDRVEANSFQAARRLKAGGGQDWPPHGEVFTKVHAPKAPEYNRVRAMEMTARARGKALTPFS